MASLYEKIDLPDRFGPMTVKEIRQGLRRGFFLVPFIVIHFLAVAATYAEFKIDDSLYSDRFTGVMQLELFFDSGPFWAVTGFVCMFFMPLGALALMTEEMEEGNYELLQMTPLDRWRIIKGKFFAMWSICMLTFSSLLPYMIVRYFVGGMDIWRNIAMALSVVGGSAIICAGALAASAYKGMLVRGLILTLFLASAYASGMLVLGFSAMVANSCGIFFHINAMGFIFCYVTLGHVMARSRIRLVVHQYEVKPSWMVVGLLIFTPMVAGMATLMSAGWFGGVGLIAMSFIAKYADVSPKGAGYLQVKANIPLNPHHLPNPAPLQAAKLDENKAGPPPLEPNVESNTEAGPLATDLPPVSKPAKFPEVDKKNHDGWT